MLNVETNLNVKCRNKFDLNTVNETISFKLLDNCNQS